MSRVVRSIFELQRPRVNDRHKSVHIVTLGARVCVTLSQVRLDLIIKKISRTTTSQHYKTTTSVYSYSSPDVEEDV